LTNDSTLREWIVWHLLLTASKVLPDDHPAVGSLVAAARAILGVAAAGGPCPRCGGSETVTGLSYGRGPDDYEVDYPCPECCPEPTSLVRLPKSKGVVTGMGNVDQHVPVATTGTQEVATGLVNLGHDGPEHDLESAVSATPHAGTPVAGGNGTPHDKQSDFRGLETGEGPPAHAATEVKSEAP
jgi:hypothetical protein